MSLYLNIDDADWNFMDDEQTRAVIAGGRDAYFNVPNPSVLENVDDYEQNALLYAATHRAEIETYESLKGLRRHIKDQMMRDTRTDRDRTERNVSLDAMFEDDEEDE